MLEVVPPSRISNTAECCQLSPAHTSSAIFNKFRTYQTLQTKSLLIQNGENKHLKSQARLILKSHHCNSGSEGLTHILLTEERNLKKVVGCMLSLPSSNAAAERLFSELKLAKSTTPNSLKRKSKSRWSFTYQKWPHVHSLSAHDLTVNSELSTHLKIPKVMQLRTR